MKIATWNVGRPEKTGVRNGLLADVLRQTNADILVITETNEAIPIGDGYHCFSTAELKDHYYNPGERRTMIYSRYPAVKRCDTFNGETSLCIETSTGYGPLVIYGTVIGSHGNRKSSFNEDLNHHLTDFDLISQYGNICISGDFNTSFCDNYYNTQYGRNRLNTAFDKLQLVNLTADLLGNIDHIVISKAFLADKKYDIDIWNEDKKLSDHIGVLVTLLN